MASIKVSELPAVTAITPSDVLIINDENLTTSSITISLFTSSFTSQNLTYTGNVTFTKPVTYSVASVPTFNTDVRFNGTANFQGPIILGPAAQIPLNSLSNVSVASPAVGQVLSWDDTNSIWIAADTGTMDDLVDDTTPQLGGNLDVNGYSIISASSGAAGPGGTSVTLDPNGAGQVIFAGNSTRGAGQFVLNCEANSHGITIKGPAHAAAASYTWIYPSDMGTTGQVLTTDGTDHTSWTAITPAGIGAATTAQGALADSALQPAGGALLPEYADETAAKAGGLAQGALYRTAEAVKQVLT